MALFPVIPGYMEQVKNENIYIFFNIDTNLLQDHIIMPLVINWLVPYMILEGRNEN